MDSNHLLATIGQYSLIRNEEGKILVLERIRSKMWCLPGGRLNEDEDWESALVREVKEETNLDCKNPVPFATNILKDEYQTKYCVYFTVEISEIEAFVMSGEHSRYEWISLGDIDQIHLEDEKIRKVVAGYFRDFSKGFS